MKKFAMLVMVLIALVAVSSAFAEEWLSVSGEVYLPLKQDGSLVGTTYRLAKGGKTSEREFKLPLGNALKGANKPFTGVIYNQKAMAFDYETLQGLSPVKVSGRIRADYVLPEETPLEALQRHLSYTADSVKKNYKTTRVFKASVVKKSVLVFEGWMDVTESSLWELNPEEEGLTFKGAKVAPKKSKKPSTTTTTTTAPTPTPTPGTEETTEWTIGGETTTTPTPTPTPSPSPIDWDIGGDTSSEEDTGWTIGGTSSDSSSSSSAEDTGWTIGGSTSSDSSNSTPTTSVSWDIGGGNGSSSEDTGFTIGGGDSSNMEDTGFSI